MQDIWLASEQRNKRKREEEGIKGEEEEVVPAASHQSQIHSDLQVSSLIRLNVRELQGFLSFRQCVCVLRCVCFLLGVVQVLRRDTYKLVLCKKFLCIQGKLNSLKCLKVCVKQ